MLGVLIALLPIGAVIYAAIWILLLLTTRISSVARGMGAAISAPVSEFLLGTRDYFPLLLGFAALVLWKHRVNLARVKAGIEPKLGKGTGRAKT